MAAASDVYALNQGQYLIKKEKMMRNKVSTNEGKGREVLTWTVCSDVKSLDVPPKKEFNVKYGIYGFKFDHKLVMSDGCNYCIKFENLLVQLFPGNIGDLFDNLNMLLWERFVLRFPKLPKRSIPFHSMNS